MDASNRRYYTPWQIGIGTFLAGPLAGGYFLSRDHQLFGDTKKAQVTLLVSCILVVGLITVGALLPKGGSGAVLGGAVAGMYRWLASGAVDSEISRRRTEGWTAYSWWRVVGISLAILVGMLACAYFVLRLLAAR